MSEIATGSSCCGADVSLEDINVHDADVSYEIFIENSFITVRSAKQNSEESQNMAHSACSHPPFP